MDIIKEFKSNIRCIDDLVDMKVELKQCRGSTSIIVSVGDYHWSEYIPKEITSGYLEESAYDFIRNWSITKYMILKNL